MGQGGWFGVWYIENIVPISFAFFLIVCGFGVYSIYIIQKRIKKACDDISNKTYDEENK